jgi:hypothetical protein
MFSLLLIGTSVSEERSPRAAATLRKGLVSIPNQASRGLLSQDRRPSLVTVHNEL